MKHMKKFFALAIVFALLAALTAGCGQKNDDVSGKGATDEAKTSAQEPAVKQEEEEKTETGTGEAQKTESISGIKTVEYKDEEVQVDENGTPLTEEEIADINGGDTSSEDPGVALEYTDYDVFLQDSEIEVEVPKSLPFEPEYVSYMLYSNGMYEICYEDEQENKVYFRKGKGTDNISGVNISFDKKEIGEINGYDVIFGIVDGKYVLATWTDGSYAYSVYADPGYDLDTIGETVSSVKAAAE